MDDVEVSRPTENVTVVALWGEHDLRTARKLDDLLDEAISSSKLVVVDVSNAAFIDSSVINTLVRAHRTAPALRSRFVLQMGTAPAVRRALEITGLLERLECADSRDEALAKAGS